jgi:hypothetical protein
MRKIYFLTIIFLSLFASLKAQQVHEKFMQTSQINDPPAIGWSYIDNTYWTAAVHYNELYVTHFDATGVPLMRKVYVSSAYAYLTCNIEVIGNGQCYISGELADTYQRYYIQQIDINGNVLWMRTYVPNHSDLAYAKSKFKVLPNGELMIIESVNGHLGYIHTDMLGALITANSYADDPLMMNKMPGFGADAYPDGSVIMSGKRGSDICLIKTDPLGVVQWSTMLGGSYYHAKDVLALPTGGAITCGMENNSPFIMMVDSTGTMQWFNSYSGSQIFYDVAQVNSNEFLAIGTNWMTTVVLRFDINGNEISTFELTDNNNGTFYGASLTTTWTGGLAIPAVYSNPNGLVGQTMHLMDYGAPLGCTMAPTTLTASTSSTDPALVAGQIYEFPLSVNVAVMVPVITNLTVTAPVDNCALLDVDDNISAFGISLTNNPAEQGTPLVLSLGNYVGDIEYNVYNTAGQAVRTSKSYYASPMEIASDGLVPGIYILEVNADGARSTEKFVVR